MNSRAKRKKDKRAAEKKARAEQRSSVAEGDAISSSAKVIQAMASPPQQPGYAVATINGVIRFDTSTPPHVLGAYTEGLESCVAVVFFNKLNHRCSLVHKPMPIAFGLLIEEFKWVSDNYTTLETCEINLIYTSRPPRELSEPLFRKWVKEAREHVEFLSKGFQGYRDELQPHGIRMPQEMIYDF